MIQIMKLVMILGMLTCANASSSEDDCQYNVDDHGHRYRYNLRY